MWIEQSTEMGEKTPCGYFGPIKIMAAHFILWFLHCSSIKKKRGANEGSEEALRGRPRRRPPWLAGGHAVQSEKGKGLRSLGGKGSAPTPLGTLREWAGFAKAKGRISRAKLVSISFSYVSHDCILIKM